MLSGAQWLCKMAFPMLYGTSAHRAGREAGKVTFHAQQLNFNGEYGAILRDTIV